MPRPSHCDRDNGPLLPFSSTLNFWLDTWPLAYRLYFTASFVTRCGQRPGLANRIWEPLLGLHLKPSVVRSSILSPPVPQLECQCGNEQALATQMKTTPSRTVEQSDGTVEQSDRTGSLNDPVQLGCPTSLDCHLHVHCYRREK